jgi:hypothetical protein
MIHKAKALSPDQKMLVETLLGRRVLEDEAISVRAFEPPALSDERRQETNGRTGRMHGLKIVRTPPTNARR